MKQYWPWLTGRIFMGTVFAYAGYTKLMEPYENFRGAIAHYEVIPYALTGPIARALPWFELFFGVFLILGYLPRISALTLAFFSLVFLVIMGASNVLFDSGGKDCGCFGEGGLIHLTVHQVFFLDILNFFLGLKLYSLKDHAFSLHRRLAA